MTPRAQLVRELVLVADDIEARGYCDVGVIRRAARVICGVDTLDPPDQPATCPGCDEPLVQADHGPPRTTCSDRCRKRVARRTG